MAEQLLVQTSNRSFKREDQTERGNRLQIRRKAFKPTPIEEWSVETRERAKYLLSLNKTEWHMNYQDFCILLEIFLKPIELWPVEQRAKLNQLQSLIKQWDISDDDFCTLLMELIYYKSVPWILKYALNWNDSDITQDCDRIPDFDELHNALVGNNSASLHVYGHDNHAIIAALSQQIKVNHDEKQSSLESNVADDESSAADTKPQQTKLNADAPEFFPTDPAASAMLSLSAAQRKASAISVMWRKTRKRWINTLESICETEELSPTETTSHSITSVAPTESTDTNVEPANIAPTNVLATAINVITDAIEICQPPPMLYPASATNHVQTQLQSDEIRNEDNTADVVEVNEDQKMNDNNNDSADKPRIPAKILQKFHPKFTNHAKGNFYISKEMIFKMTQKAMEDFVTNDANETDEKLAFGYYKESVAMQLNDEQLNIIQCNDNKLRIVINIDLHSKKNGLSMYLVAGENKEQYKIKWCIIAFMSETEIYHQFGVLPNQLPASSRNMDEIQEALNNPPVLRLDEVQRLLKRTKFRGLPEKTNKRKDDRHKALKRIQIGEYWLKKYCQDSWNDHDAVPVVVIKGNGQWIEWKKFIRIEDRFGNPEWVGMSLRYYPANRRWKIECMDYDAGRIYYQHRLVGLSDGDDYSYSYNELREYVTTSLKITN